MKSTGIIRKLDNVNRLVIPHEATSQLDFEENEEVEVFVDGDSIILKKAFDKCTFCGSQEGLRKFKNKYICGACNRETKSL